MEQKIDYRSPQCKVIEVQIQQVIATSETDDITITNAFGRSTEDEW